jgi:hypothetical protein
MKLFFVGDDDCCAWMQSETIDLTELRQRGDGITNFFARSDAMARFKEQADKTANFVDSDGLPYIGQVLETFILD